MVYQFLANLQKEIVDYDVESIKLECSNPHRDFKLKFEFLKADCVITVSERKQVLSLSMDCKSLDSEEELCGIIGFIVQRLNLNVKLNKKTPAQIGVEAEV